MTLDKVGNLAEHNATLMICQSTDAAIGTAVAIRQVQRMQSIAALCLYQRHQGSRQLGIQQDLHADSSSTLCTRASCAA
jgi:hypothetical protein